ncbi:MAG: Nudix family hydrolase [Pseudomonadota bacterium]|nr:Nudix family hydrolase [Pseudomonadota bacterium]
MSSPSLLTTQSSVLSSLHVAVAVLRNAEGKILLSRRRKGTHLAGLWEFPGGKLEAGESLSGALRREIKEELGIQILTHRPLIQISHSYPEKQVFLDVHLVNAWQGTAAGMEGQQIAWAAAAEIDEYHLPPADRPIVTAIRLPSRYLITPPSIDDESIFLQQLEASLQQGIRLLQLRLPGYDKQRLASLADRVIALCHAYGAALMVKDESLAVQLGCGLHLGGSQLRTMRSRNFPQQQLLAASCHTQQELAHAASIGVDFATLSPVQPTATHPQAQPLGWNDFSAMVRRATLPVYALGGMQIEHRQQAWRSGAQGIAAIRGLFFTKQFTRK